jgi:transcriptional regulator with XRE-family HTH domain
MAAGLTQERLAERIGKSVETVRAYEAGSRDPDPDTVVKMADACNAQYLAYQYLQQTAPGLRLLPEIELHELPTAILRFLKEVRELMDCQQDLIAIGADGVIAPDEQDQWIKIIGEFGDVKKAIIELELSQGQSRI